MKSPIGINELAAASGLTRRAIRFYVQQKLLSPPTGLGRSSQYDTSHLDRLRRIAELQQSGHSLDAIRQILNGLTTEASLGRPAAPRRRREMEAQLWTRLTVADGVELHFDASRHSPTVEDLVELRHKLQNMFHKQS